VTASDNDDAAADHSSNLLIPRRTARLLEAAEGIRQEPPDRMDFLHTVLCQVGLPRSKVHDRTYERKNGHVSMLLEAGRLYDGRDFVEQPLPYGATPRLVLVHVSSEAVRTRQPAVEIGDSMRQFLMTLGMQTSGGERGGYTVLKRQMEALSACRMTLGMYADGRAVTVHADPIKRFDAWLHQDGLQRTLWPGVLELSPDFFNTLVEHAVPLDHRALAALKHSSLALDIYTWLAHRLCRVNRAGGVKLSWSNLKEQFGPDYSASKDFKKEFRQALRQVCAVYPDARVEEVIGGLLLFPSRAPMAATRIAMPPVGSLFRHVDK
jgi:hypothetical protein